MPSPNLDLAVVALFRSLRLLAMANLLESVLTTPVSCAPSTAGSPVASSTKILPLLVPVSSVADVPSPRFVLAVPALFRSLRLLDTAKKSVLADNAAVPRPRCPLAVVALVMSPRLLTTCS